MVSDNPSAPPRSNDDTRYQQRVDSQTTNLNLLNVAKPGDLVSLSRTPDTAASHLPTGFQLVDAAAKPPEQPKPAEQPKPVEQPKPNDRTAPGEEQHGATVVKKDDHGEIKEYANGGYTLAKHDDGKWFYHQNGDGHDFVEVKGDSIKMDDQGKVSYSESGMFGKDNQTLGDGSTGIMSAVTSAANHVGDAVVNHPLDTFNSVAFAPIAAMDAVTGGHGIKAIGEIEKGAAEEVVNHPGEILTDVAIGAAIGAVTVATGGGALVALGIGAAALAGTELVKNDGNIDGVMNDAKTFGNTVGNWGNDLITVAGTGKHTQQEEAAAEAGLHQLGAFGAHMAAGTVGGVAGGAAAEAVGLENAIPNSVRSGISKFRTGASNAPAEEINEMLAGSDTMAGAVHSNGSQSPFGRIENQPTPLYEPVSLGRNGDIKISGDFVSREHAHFFRSEENGFLRDANSANGTWVNGKRISSDSWTRLEEGDHVVLGAPDGPNIRFAETPASSVRAAIDKLSLPNEVMKVPENYRPPNDAMYEAIDQSNYFGANHELNGRLRDGYVDGGKFARVDDDYNVSGRSSREAIVVDRNIDQVLNLVRADAQERFGHLPPTERAAALSEYSRSLLTPRGMSSQDLDAALKLFGKQNAGEKVLLGDYIRQGKGVCIQQATLLKVLAEDANLDATLVRGAVNKNLAHDMNHAWTHIRFGETDEPLVYDPRMGRAGEPYDALPAHKRYYQMDDGKRVLPLEPHNGLLESVRIGNNRQLLRNGREIQVGRNDEEYSSDPLVSRQHGVLGLKDGKLVYTDNSVNGTWINGFRVSRGTQNVVNPTDDIRLGGRAGSRLPLSAAVEANRWS